jgi:16S rRNA processing protein RimM
MNDSLMLVGQVGRPFGVKGYCRLRLYSDNPARFVEDIGQAFILKNSKRVTTGEVLSLKLEDVTEKGDSLVVKWEGIDSPEDVRRYSGWEIFWDGPDDWVPDEEEGIRISQLVGMKAVDCETLHLVGKVIGFYERPGQDLLSIETPGGEVLCPFVGYLVPRVDRVLGEVHVRWSVVGTSE